MKSPDRRVADTNGVWLLPMFWFPKIEWNSTGKRETADQPTVLTSLCSIRKLLIQENGSRKTSNDCVFVVSLPFDLRFRLLDPAARISKEPTCTSVVFPKQCVRANWRLFLRRLDALLRLASSATASPVLKTHQANFCWFSFLSVSIDFPFFVAIFKYVRKQPVFRRASVLFGLTRAARRNVPSRNWTAPCHKEPPSPSPSSSPTTRATRPKDWLRWLPIYLVNDTPRLVERWLVIWLKIRLL